MASNYFGALKYEGIWLQQGQTGFYKAMPIESISEDDWLHTDIGRDN